MPDEFWDWLPSPSSQHFLAVTLALEHPGARVWATDLSADALKLARKNVARYALAERVTLLHGDRRFIGRGGGETWTEILT